MNFLGTLPVSSGGTGGVNTASARSNLGLGSAATRDTGTTSGRVPILDSSGDLALSVIPDGVGGFRPDGGVQRGMSLSLYDRLDERWFSNVDELSAFSDWFVVEVSTWRAASFIRHPISQRVLNNKSVWRMPLYWSAFTQWQILFSFTLSAMVTVFKSERWAKILAGHILF